MSFQRIGRTSITQLLASLMFASPWWGVGVGVVVAGAVAAHLVTRGHGRRVVFPAVRFAIVSQTESLRWRRLRRWLLMLWRAAAVALIALAFMQPRWQPTAEGGVAAGEHVAIVVDRSASMGRVEDGATLFAEARRRAIDLLRSLDAQRDRASVILLDARPMALLPEPSSQFEALIERLEAVAVSHEHGRLSEALARVREVHRRLPSEQAGSLRVEIFSDGQATHWPTRGWGALVGAETVVRHHALGGFAGNVAIGQPRMRPAQPVAGQPARMVVEIANHAETAATIDVVLNIDEDRGKARQTVRVDPFAATTVAFDVVFDEPGVVLAELAIPAIDDALPADNRVGMFISVRAARPVHLLTLGDVNDADSAAYFVSRALQPHGGKGDADRALGGVALRVGGPRDLAGAAFEHDAVIVLVETGELSAAEQAGLASHVRQGGGAVWVADCDAAVRSVAAMGVVMAPINGTAAERQQQRRLVAGRFDQPVLAVFEGPSRSALLRSQFGRSWAGRLADDAEALLYFDDGSPALAWGDVGAGRLAMMAGSISPHESNLMRGSAAAPLLHQLVRHLSPGETGQPAVSPGQAVDLQVQGGQRVVGPGGRMVAMAELGRVDEPGAYGVWDEAEQRWRDGVWVSVDRAESDLRPAIDGPLEAGEASVGRSAWGVGVSRGDGLELWGWFVVAGVLLLVLEPMVVGVLGRRRGVMEGGDGGL